MHGTLALQRQSEVKPKTKVIPMSGRSLTGPHHHIQHYFFLIALSSYMVPH